MKTNVRKPIALLTLLGAGAGLLLLIGGIAAFGMWAWGHSDGYSEAYKKCYDNAHPEQQITEGRIITGGVFLMFIGLGIGLALHGPPLQFKSTTETNIYLDDEELETFLKKRKR